MGWLILSATAGSRDADAVVRVVPRAPHTACPSDLRWWGLGRLPVQVRLRGPLWASRTYRTELGAGIAAACVATVAGHPVEVVETAETVAEERIVYTARPHRWPGATTAARAVLAAMRVEALATFARAVVRASRKGR